MSFPLRHLSLWTTSLLASLGGAGAAAQPCPRWDGAIGRPGNSLIPYESILALTPVIETGETSLYAGGYFTQFGTEQLAWIAEWDGSEWSGVGGGMDGPVYAMTVFDDGTSPGLFVVGAFERAGTVAAHGIAKWDGQQWSALGSGINGYAQSVYVHDDGSGSA